MKIEIEPEVAIKLIKYLEGKRGQEQEKVREILDAIAPILAQLVSKRRPFGWTEPQEDRTH